MHLRFILIFAIGVLVFELSISNCSAQLGRADVGTTQAVSVRIPITKSSHRTDTSYLYKCVRRDASQMGMDQMERGYDSLQIRIWLGHSLAVKRNVVVLKCRNTIWSGELWTFTYGHTQTGGEFVGSKTVSKVVPKSGWHNFTKDLFEYHISVLPDDDSLRGYNGCGFDGVPYYFEIATLKQYRFFKYCNPEENKSGFREARDVIGIASLLEREFSFTFTR